MSSKERSGSNFLERKNLIINKSSSLSNFNSGHSLLNLSLRAIIIDIN